MANRRNPYTAFVAAAAVLCLGFSLWLWFHAGCVGDTKSGSYGNPVRALELERDAFISLVAGVFGTAIAIVSLGSIGVVARIGCSLGFIVLGGPALWLLGLDFETRGVQACFRSNSRLQRPAVVVTSIRPRRIMELATDAAAAEPPCR